MFLLNKLKKMRAEYAKRMYMVDLRKNCILPEDSLYINGFNVQFRNVTEGKTYMEVGHNSVLSGNYIFETETGNIKIGDRVYIGGSTLICKTGITIDDDVTIAWGCTIYDHNSHSIRWEERAEDIINVYESLINGNNFIENKNWENVKTAPIHICSKAWIGMNSIILKGVTIGEGAVVGAGSVVTKDVPPWTMVCGNPATVVKKTE